MNADLLAALIAALQLSPDNPLLRTQVVQGLLDCRRYDEVEPYARPLLNTEHRALALFALAHAAHAADDLTAARSYYDDAVKMNPALEDEDFEAALQPAEPISLSLDDFDMPPTGATRVPTYAGPRVTFEDVGGMAALKEQIRMNIIYPFQHPEIFQAYGKKVGGGILLFGPPGCGKTHIARATAGELGANFYIIELDDILSKWMGETEQNLGDIFTTARMSGQSVIFIDEMDALGGKRSDMGAHWARSHVSHLLTEMDGVNTRNDELLIIGATNAPWDVDSAFRRPGRFDRVLFVPPPDLQAREEILQLHARNRKMAPGIAWRQLAERTALFSGADLAALVDRACEVALGEALRSGNLRDVTQNDFLRVLKEMRPSTVDWLRRAKNYVTYANQDGLYDDLAHYLDEVKLR